jgi:2-oxoisovalerate dehydrogenase E1 component alpha subunit
MIRNLLKKTLGSGVRCISWKNMDNYYNYPFTNKPEWIDHTVRFPIFRAMDLEGNVFDPKYEVIDKATAQRILDTMIIHRETDKILLNMHRQGRITFYMATLLEEAIGPAIGSAIKNDDQIILQYREQGIMLWRGFTHSEMMHHVKGTNKDSVKGKALVFHYAEPKLGILPVSAPIGSKIGHATGLGYAFRTKKEDKIAVCFFGEGAASQGDFHAGLNFAATLGSQVLYVCRNNCYAISTPIEDQYAGDGIAPRGIGYGIPSLKVDGCDPLAIHYATAVARKMIMERKGPVMIETYSYRGGDHSTSDSSATYRTKEVMKKLQPYLDAIGDPIIRMGKYLEKKGWLKSYKDHVVSLSEKTKADCQKIAKEVDAAPFSDYHTMFKDVYAETPWNLKEQQEELDAHLKKYHESYPMDNYKD